MNPAKQFWTLFKFHLIANPYIWFFMFSFCTPLFFISSANLDLDSLARNQSLIFIGFIGVMFLAPEIFGSFASNQYPLFQSEFLLTRAIDRTMLARAKGAGFYFLVLLVPVFMLLLSLKNPDLKVVSFEESERQACLSFIRGSVLLKSPHEVDHLAIPSGKILIAAWHAWACLSSAIVVQLLIALIYPFPYRKYVVWGLFGSAILLPLISLYFHAKIFAGNRLFFLFAAHQTLFWTETLFLVVLSQLWCEQRFARQEV